MFKIGSLLFVLILVMWMMWFLPSSAGRLESDRDTFQVSIPVPNGMQLVEVIPDTQPALFQFFMQSDYVVIASVTNKRPIGKRNKDPNNIAEWQIGSLDTFQVEELLYSNKDYDPDQQIRKTGSVDVFRLRDLQSNIADNTRYLLFLKEIPSDEEIFRTLELDKGKTFFRTYVGNQSIFPGQPDRFHGKNNHGKIDLNAGQYPTLVQTIRQFAKVLSEPDPKARSEKFKELLTSKNETLRLNAEFALKSLSN